MVLEILLQELYKRIFMEWFFTKSATAPWVQVGVDVSNYLGQQIYINFDYGANGEGDLGIDLVRVQSCCSPSINVGSDQTIVMESLLPFCFRSYYLYLG